MARKCQISKKGALTGNRVSHSNRRTKRRQELNLQSKTYDVPELGRKVKFRLTSKMIKTISKKGISAVLRKYKVIG